MIWFCWLFGLHIWQVEINSLAMELEFYSERGYLPAVRWYCTRCGQTGEYREPPKEA